MAQLCSAAQLMAAGALWQLSIGAGGGAGRKESGLCAEKKIST